MMKHWTFFSVLSMLFGLCHCSESRGPVFVLEPPTKLDFSNSSGGWLDCSATGSPAPAVAWLAADGGAVSDVPGVRRVLNNGTLVLLPFHAAAFRQDVHSTSYRCLAENEVGRVLSRAVHVRAVVMQAYQAQAEALPAARGCTVVLRCVLPSFVRELVRVVSWLQEPSFYIYPSLQGDGKFHLLPTGELLIHHVETNDQYPSYRCRTMHRLTRQVVVSSPASVRIIPDARGVVPPTIVEHSATVHVIQDEGAVLVCAIQGCPTPNIKWYRLGSVGPIGGARQPIPIVGDRDELGGRARALGPLLALEGAGPEDAGLYRCAANNSGGAAKAELRLFVSTSIKVSVTPHLQIAELGSTAEFHCEASPEAAVTGITWLKDGRPVAGGGSRRLLVRPVQREDRGMYQCVARTEEGAAAQAAAELQLGDAPPTLLYSFIEQTLQPGPAVSLKCSASGTPTPSIRWTLDGFPLPSVDRFVMGQYVTVHGDVISHVNVSHVSVEDGGEYACVAENRAGQTSHAARLNVYGLPYVRPIPKVTAVAGDTLYLKCPVAGFPIEDVRWERGGRELPVELRQKVFPNGTLAIRHVQKPADAGTYTCTARNKQGHSARRSGEVTVIEPPKISPFSIDRTFHLGERTTLTCTVIRGDSPLVILWLRNGRSVSTAGNASGGVSINQVDPFNSILFIEALTPEHNGNYTCEARNEAASATHTQRILVNVPPSIEPFTFQEGLTEGMRTRTICGVSRGDPPISISWLKDESPVVPDSYVNITVLDNYSTVLSIAKLLARHSGEYKCVASNEAARVHFTATLKVKVPPRWVVEPADTSAARGRSVVLQCSAEGVPAPTIVWKKATGSKSGDYQEVRGQLHQTGWGLTGGGQYKVLGNGSLLLQNVREEHEGFYLCHASNGVGEGVGKVIQLHVNSEPYFAVQSRLVSVHKGEVASLKCDVSGDTPISVTWLRGKELVSPTSNYRYSIQQEDTTSGVSSMLQISPAEGADAGAYVCQATNVYGHAQQLVQLAVQEPPASPAALEIVMLGGRSASIRWQPSASGEVAQYFVHFIEDTGSWEQSRTLTVPGNIHSVVLEPLTPATRYVARVVAQGPAGRSAPSPELRLTTHAQRPAGPPLQLSVTPVSPSALAVSWSPPRTELQHGTILSYNVGFRQVTGSGNAANYNFTSVAADTEEQRNSLLLSDLRKFSRYWIAVQAVNQEGAGPLSEPVTVSTLEDVPSRPPQDVRCSALSPQSLQISWQPPPEAHTHGQLQGYRIVYEAASPHESSAVAAIPESRQTQALTIVINALSRHANYSVQVAAVTGAGDGPLSRPIFCKTAEDVPDAPRDIKVVASGPMSLLVSWLPPVTPRGSLTGYTLHSRVLIPGSQQQAPPDMQPSPRSMPPAATSFELPSLRAGAEYHFWVTAATRVGEGPATRVVAAIPTLRVPARIASFGEHVTRPWRSSVALPCVMVGQPTPSREWFRDATLLPTRHSADGAYVAEDGALRIDSATRGDQGNYSCHVRNNEGADRILYRLTVQVPPSAPSLFVRGTTSNSLLLHWNTPDTGNAPLAGYSLHFRPSQGDWEELNLPRYATSHELKELRCGSEYHVFMTAHGLVGSSPASTQLTVRTQGSRPAQPPQHATAHAQLLQANSTSLLLRLHAWPDGGCPITRLELQYRVAGAHSWTLVPEHMQPQRRVTVSGLAPATMYELQARAHNSAGATTALFSFTTLTADGEIAPPELITRNSGPKPFYTEVRIVVPLVVSCFAVLGATVAACLCWRNKSASERGGSEEGKQARLENAHNAEQQYYATIHKLGEKVPENAEDISPYATFHLAETAPRVASHTPARRGPQPAAPGPPHLLHAFVYREQPGTEGCASPPSSSLSSIVEHARRCVSQVYGQQQRRRAGSSSSGRGATGKSKLVSGFDNDDLYRNSPPESEDSDPEQPTSSRTESSNQLDNGRHRTTVYQGAASSTSSDLSPTSDRKSLPRRGKPGRNRWQRHPRLQQQTTRPGSEETSLTQRQSRSQQGPPAYSELQPPTLGRGAELSEAECDIDTLKKLKLRAASSLWSRPSASHHHSTTGDDFSIAV